MRFRHPDGSVVHLAYCTNVHPAEDLDGVLAQLGAHCAPVRRRLGVDRLGVGLWLAAGAARTLDTDPRALRTLRDTLDRHGLEVVTLNGFPYEGFGAGEVKYRVYRPDWADPRRYAHTLALARILAALLPDDVTEGSVSTLPLAWRTAYDARRAARARAALTELAGRLDELARTTGRSVRVALEPEPGCVVETCADAIGPLTAVGHDRIGVCVDTCHLATSFEEPETALPALTAAGVGVVKAQVSAALHAEHPDRPGTREALAAFAEPRFLHQTRTLTAAGLRGTDDLAPALTGARLPAGSPWRSHFHVPLHAAPAPPLTSTLPVLRRALSVLVGGDRPLTRHLEVETYTWQVLPPDARPRDADGLADGIAAELSLARDLLTDLGLKELP
ncbi:metabolite traffic protein EboE [Streptomyces mutabilis]|uniref:metabolite traffic protein EboE n=1 Tax=Streptomyces TaxID=1883 RepID=UPI0025B380DF|nr:MULTISPECIES: metabolite traffic protein EboE [unclassified Streptomyces]MDN3249587.1 metabolite traffic protein EboE [Streptomyces sp. ZSW22]MDN3257415.1 metabolite traffic protein EboE [Streptomyces sp. MA25(2023)]